MLPNVEEFGIAAVEAQAAGRPVVAVAAGGALETVIDGQTGILVAPDDLDALARGLAGTDFERFDSSRIVAHAHGFSKAAFQQALPRGGRAIGGAAGRLSRRDRDGRAEHALVDLEDLAHVPLHAEAATRGLPCLVSPSR